ncbi:MAG: TrkA family potassium uptake protein [Alphaproteobacteria bacterium]|nr:TrkA family potassium uptake protein [Alphaproteobacteria bacterium]
MQRKKRSFVVVGLGAFGGTVAAALAGMGDEVSGIDNDERRVREHVDKVTHVAIADARDEDALREAGAGQHDVAIVSIGEDLEASILCTMNLKLIGVPTIWVKALSRTHHRILAKIGVDRVIRPEYDMGLHVAETLHSPYVADYLSLGNGFHVINLLMPASSKLKTIEDLRALTESKVQILGFMRGTEFHTGTRNESALDEGDRVMLLGRRDDLRKLSGLL